jgi:DNA-binding response OmpR family regulator
MSFIIIADDDPVFCGLLKATLEMAGHVVGMVADGESAAAVIAFKKPDVAILDMNMPGCSGVDVVRKLRMSAATCAVPLIMLTARGGSRDADIAFRAGADDYIAKPMDPDLVLACVDRQLNGRRRQY